MGERSHSYEVKEPQTSFTSVIKKPKRLTRKDSMKNRKKAKHIDVKSVIS